MPAEPPVILFADQELSWGRRARVEFRRRGARVLTAGSVIEAMSLAGKFPPSLVILDGELGGNSEPDLVEFFLNELPGSEIIYLESRRSVTRKGTGLGLLYSGPRTTASPLLVGMAVGALRGRLGNPPAQNDFRPRRVLCVDDDERFLSSITRLLLRRGYQVSSFSAAHGALEALAVEEPDLVLLDIMMPGMGGLSLGRTLHERSAGELPVVYLTALGCDRVRQEALRHGGAFLVRKGEVPERVLDVVDYFAGDLDEVERDLLLTRLLGEPSPSADVVKIDPMGKVASGRQEGRPWF